MKRKFGYYQCLFVAPAIFLAMLVPMLFVLGPSNKFSLGNHLSIFARIASTFFKLPVQPFDNINLKSLSYLDILCSVLYSRSDDDNIGDFL